MVGSLDIIGSPTGFTRTVGAGVKDFISMPYHAMFQGPWSFVGGVSHGSASLVKHLSAGTLTSMTNFASRCGHYKNSANEIDLLPSSPRCFCALSVERIYFNF